MQWFVKDNYPCFRGVGVLPWAPLNAAVISGAWTEVSQPGIAVFLYRQFVSVEAVVTSELRLNDNWGLY